MKMMKIGGLKSIIRVLEEAGELMQVKVFVNPELEITEITDQDVSVSESKHGKTLVFVDATFKTSEHDNFKRDWPNVVTMDDKTIAAVDKKWGELVLGEFIQSPS
jgi:UbiD family decarboxylase